MDRLARGGGRSTTEGISPADPISLSDRVDRIVGGSALRYSGLMVLFTWKDIVGVSDTAPEEGVTLLVHNSAAELDTMVLPVCLIFRDVL